MLYFLVATQDIAVDGWALTLLSRANVGYASTCNSIGQTAGIFFLHYCHFLGTNTHSVFLSPSHTQLTYTETPTYTHPHPRTHTELVCQIPSNYDVGYFIAYTIFLAFNSPEFCNRYLRSIPSEGGMLPLSTFMFFWGCLYVLVTLLLILFQPEQTEKGSRSSIHSGSSNGSALPQLLSSYADMLRVIRLPSVLSLAAVLITCRIGFTGVESATHLRLIEKGMAKESLALLGVSWFPVELLFTAVIGRYTSGPRPLSLWTIGYVGRLFLSFSYLAVVTLLMPTEGSVLGDEGYGLLFYVCLLLTFMFHRMACTLMFVSQMSFFARVSDPKIGGTYMTLLNTLANLGSSWFVSPSLALIDFFTVKVCTQASADLPDGFCKSATAARLCRSTGGTCHTVTDGYVVVCLFCLLVGVVWLFRMRHRVKCLEEMSLDKWRLKLL